MYSGFENFDFSNHDFNVVQYGRRKCSPNFNVYYKSCPNYLLHYVYSGKGVLRTPEGEFNLSENRAFLIFPGQEADYCSDADEPFTYAWIEFFGGKVPDFLRASGLTAENPIYIAAPPYECGEVLRQITSGEPISPMRLTGLFWIMADCMTKNESGAEDNMSLLFSKALKYIHENSSSHITVEDVAREIAVSRGYLPKIFARFITQTPKQYITYFHINKAKSLLYDTDVSISEVAERVGYDSLSDFTHAFKKLTGMTPTEYRKLTGR